MGTFIVSVYSNSLRTIELVLLGSIHHTAYLTAFHCNVPCEELTGRQICDGDSQQMLAVGELRFGQLHLVNTLPVGCIEAHRSRNGRSIQRILHSHHAIILCSRKGIGIGIQHAGPTEFGDGNRHFGHKSVAAGYQLALTGSRGMEDSGIIHPAQ